LVDLIFFQAVSKMVQTCCTFVESMPSEESKMKLIQVIRTVTEGKVRLYLRELLLDITYVHDVADLLGSGKSQTHIQALENV